MVAISQPGAGSTVNANSMSISGTATDALTTDNVVVYYLINASNTVTSPPATPAAVTADWTKAEGGSAWFHSANLIGLGEGTNYVHVLAFDELGNRSDLAHRNFIRDTGPPTLFNWLESLAVKLMV